MPVQRSLPTPKKRPAHDQLDFVRVDGRYRVGKLLGTGRSGEPHSNRVRLVFMISLASVFLGKDIKTGADVVLKVGRSGMRRSRLSHEYDVYTNIAGSTGIPEVLWYGKEGQREIIILQHLGTSLGNLVKERQFDPKSIFLYASQMVHCSVHERILLLNILSRSQLTAIESLHNCHYIHRDIKPGNFMISVDNPSPVSFLIDFGLAQHYRDPATYEHISYTPHDQIVGTLAFSSIMGQQGCTQSRRDDLESFAYTIIYSACGELPWTGCHDSETVLAKKLGTLPNKLCQGLPDRFCDFLHHVRQLDFDEKPDYQHLHSILSLCLETETNQHIKAPSSVHVPLSAKRMPVVGGRV